MQVLCNCSHQCLESIIANGSFEIPLVKSRKNLLSYRLSYRSPNRTLQNLRDMSIVETETAPVKSQTPKSALVLIDW
jgi:hypothetical protein